MAPNEEIELTRLPTADAVAAEQRQLSDTDFGPSADDHPNIPPPDRGMAAYLFLASCFMVEALVWGFAFSFGVFQENYSREFDGQSNVAVIGTTCMGVTYLSAPFIFFMLRKWPQLRRPCTVVGLFLMCIALAAASFAQTVTHLIITHGVLYALGGGICYSPTILFVDEWFIQRKGLAFGTMWAGAGAAGVAIPIVLNWLLNSYGFRTTLRVWSLALFILTFPLLYFLKPRLPLDENRRKLRNRQLFDLSFVITPAFIVLQLCNIIEAVGYFMPTIYLPTFAKDILHTSNWTGTGTIIALNVASVAGCIAMGALNDRYHVTTCIMISTVGTVISVFLLWGFSTNLPVLYIFSIAYGLFAGSYTSAWTGIIKVTKSKAQNADTGLIFAFLAFGRGVGNVASGPLSEALLKGDSWSAGMAYGTEYGPLIAFTGVSALLGGCSYLFRLPGTKRVGGIF